MIGDKILTERKKLELTQEELAERAGIAREQINRYEKGRIIPDMDTLFKIATALNKSLNFFLENDKPGEQPKPASAQMSDMDIRFALSGGEKPISKAQFEEVKQFVRFIQERDKANGNR